jgi:hypothetical protein
VGHYDYKSSLLSKKKQANKTLEKPKIRKSLNKLKKRKSKAPTPRIYQMDKPIRLHEQKYKNKFLEKSVSLPGFNSNSNAER